MTTSAFLPLAYQRHITIKLMDLRIGFYQRQPRRNLRHMCVHGYLCVGKFTGGLHNAGLMLRVA